MSAQFRAGAPMIRISIPYIFSISEGLEPLTTIKAGEPLENHIFTIWAGQSAVQTLLQSSVFATTLRSSRQLAETLYAAIKRLADQTDWKHAIEPYEAFSITNGYGQFKTALLAEFGTFPTYFVSQKGSFDTLTLLDNPARLFPEELWLKVPEARFDVTEAGKALCYELSTACGFHVFRVTENVLRRYYAEVTKGAAQPKVRNISVYVNAMRQKKCGDEKILGVIEQIAKLHRNPLIHPEVALTLNEAIAILGIAHSAITAMLAVLPTPPTTTQTAAVNVPTASP